MSSAVVLSPSLPGVPDAAAVSARRRSARHVLKWFGAFMALSLIAWLYQQFDFAGSLDHGMPIPDVVNMSSTLTNLWSGGAIDQEENQFIGISVLYAWTWLLHPSLCFVVNIVLMTWATRTYSDVFIKRLGVPGWSVIGLLGNPYLVLAMVGPNKEVPLTLFTLLYFKAVVQRRPGWPLIAGLLALAAFLIRDGYGAFLMVTTFLLLAFRKPARPYAVLLCMGCVATATLFGVLASVIPILNRNAENFEIIAADNVAVGALASILGLDPFTPIGGFLTFALRMIYNLFSPAMFPVFRTTGGIYWEGIAYWVDGLVALTCIPACLSILRRKDLPTPVALAAAIPVATLFMISVSLFVQPRYIMPVLPLATAAFASCSKKLRSRCVQGVVAFTAFILLGYWLLDRAPPLADPDSFATPAYILGS